jgi:hypothetical protein
MPVANIAVIPTGLSGLGFVVAIGPGPTESVIKSLMG